MGGKVGEGGSSMEAILAESSRMWLFKKGKKKKDRWRGDRVEPTVT